ncbi:MAG: hypothetical protein LBG65_07875 [Puniceicoccales bacterium]|jgi:hypothetical protein|nr:hypothetical protein [Puniceicoccales bacterium]
MKTKRFVLLTTTALFGAASALSVAKAWSDARELNAMASESAGKLPSLASTTPSPAPCYGADVGDKVCREDWQGIGADGGHLILDQNKLRELPRGAQAWFCELAKEDERTQKLVKNASAERLRKESSSKLSVRMR